MRTRYRRLWGRGERDRSGAVCAGEGGRACGAGLDRFSRARDDRVAMEFGRFEVLGFSRRAMICLWLAVVG